VEEAYGIKGLFEMLREPFSSECLADTWRPTGCRSDLSIGWDRHVILQQHNKALSLSFHKIVEQAMPSRLGGAYSGPTEWLCRASRGFVSFQRVLIEAQSVSHSGFFTKTALT
jgi:hypothetical protein